MESLVILEITLVVFLLGLSGFFSSSETIFFSLNPMRIRRISERNPYAGTQVHNLMTNPSALLSTILIGNTIVNVAVAALGFAAAENLSEGFGEIIAIPLVTLVLIVFGEVIPKRVGLYYAEQLSPWYAPTFTLLIKVLKPLRLALDAMTQAITPLIRPHGKTLSEEEFETVLDISGEEGVINGDELAMLKAIIQLEDLTASHVMTPRVDIIGIDLEDEEENPVEIARKARRKYLLLYGDSLDQVVGFLDVRAFLLDPEHNLKSATIAPFFVPEGAPLNMLLTRFQTEKRRIAVVVDEYGGTAGVVTRGDILEEITGEIYQELNKPRPLWQSAGPNRWLVDANTSLEELNRKLDLDLEDETSDRLAGWIASNVGHMPEKDDVVENQGVRVTVLQTIRLRVTLAMIEVLQGNKADEDTEAKS